MEIEGLDIIEKWYKSPNNSIVDACNHLKVSMQNESCEVFTLSYQKGGQEYFDDEAYYKNKDQSLYGEETENYIFEI